MSFVSVVSDSATPWTVDHQAPLSMGFSRQEDWSGLPFPSPGDLAHAGVQPTSPASPALVGGFSTTEPPGKPILCRSYDDVQKTSKRQVCWILEWVATPFSRASSWSRDQPRSPALQADSLLSRVPWGLPCLSLLGSLKVAQGEGTAA